MSDLEKIKEGVLAGDVEGVVAGCRALVAGGMPPLDIINRGLIAGMAVVGKKFKAGDMFMPEVLMSARAMGAGVDVVKPLMAEEDVPTAGKVVIGTVAGDLHDIGKNLVVIMLESGGYQVVNLGVDISPESFVEAVREHQPDILGLSALLTTTMLAMKDTIDALEEAGVRQDLKVIIGGAPVTADFADEIGADGFAPDAPAAVELADRLLA
jgi:5-methyltetrahydrofolate--homocysteine methyltransferase